MMSGAFSFLPKSSTERSTSSRSNSGSEQWMRLTESHQFFSARLFSLSTISTCSALRETVCSFSLSPGVTSIGGGIGSPCNDARGDNFRPRHVFAARRARADCNFVGRLQLLDEARARLRGVAVEDAVDVDRKDNEGGVE